MLQSYEKSFLKELPERAAAAQKLSTDAKRRWGKWHGTAVTKGALAHRAKREDDSRLIGGDYGPFSLASLDSFPRGDA